MTIRDDFDQAVQDIFAAFDDVPFSATYIEKQNSAYIPGGTVTQVEVNHVLDIFLLGNQENFIEVATDVDNENLEVFFRTRDLPIRADVKDEILINGIRYTIDSTDFDPADAGTTCFVSKS